MNEPVQQRFDYASLDADTREFLQDREEKIHNLARATAEGIVRIGQYLTEAKARLGHGKFEQWIKDKFAWSDDSARNFMRVYECFKSRNFRDLDINVSALYLIAAPKTPEPVRTEIIRRAETGEPVTHASVKAVMRQFEETGNLPAATAALSTIVVRAQEQKRQAESEAQVILPAPAEARRIAIATGAHTLDSTGTYQPPLTREAQDEWRQDSDRLSRLRDFIYWHQDGQDVEELTDIVIRRHWMTDFHAASLGAAIQWLQQFQEALCRKIPVKKISEKKSVNGSRGSSQRN